MRLFAFEKAWAEVTFAAMFPDGTRLPRGVSGMHPGVFLDDTIAAVDLEPSLGIRLALWICAFSPVLFLRRPVLITGVSPDERERALDLATKSSIYAIRQLVIALKAMAALLYAQAPDVRQTMMHVTPEEHEMLVALRHPRGARAPEPDDGALPANDDVHVGRKESSHAAE